jgi:hypothetical protein
MRVEIYVRPGASATWVGGEFDGLVVVHVTARATAGRATAAALAALASALSLSPSALRLVGGAKNKRKLIDVDVSDTDAPAIAQRLVEFAARSERARNA